MRRVLSLDPLGNLPAALQSFEDGLAIAKRLAKADPDNAGWQRDLIISNVKLADVTGDNAYNVAAPNIALAMSEKGILVPADAWMVDELRRRAGRD